MSLDDVFETTPGKIWELIRRFSYKPNWQFTVEPGYDGTTVLVARQWVEDSRRPFDPWPDLEISVEDEDFMPSRDKLVRARQYNMPFSPRRRLVPVHARIHLPSEFHGERHFWDFVRHEVVPKLEDHEIDEWFKVDGSLPYDPHKEKK